MFCPRRGHKFDKSENSKLLNDYCSYQKGFNVKRKKLIEKVIDFFYTDQRPAVLNDMAKMRKLRRQCIRDIKNWVLEGGDYR